MGRSPVNNKIKIINLSWADNNDGWVDGNAIYNKIGLLQEIVDEKYQGTFTRILYSFKDPHHCIKCFANLLSYLYLSNRSLTDISGFPRHLDGFTKFGDTPARNETPCDSIRDTLNVSKFSSFSVLCWERSKVSPGLRGGVSSYW